MLVAGNITTNQKLLILFWQDILVSR